MDEFCCSQPFFFPLLSCVPLENVLLPSNNSLFSVGVQRLQNKISVLVINARITENPSKRPTLRLCLPLHRRHVSSEKSFSALHLLGCNWKVPPHPSGGLGSPQGSASTQHHVWGRGTEGPILGPRQPPTVEAADAHGGGSSLLEAAGNSPCLWVNDQKTL